MRCYILTKVDNNGIIKLDINCGCGKLLAKVKDNKLYLYCKSCKKEIEIKNLKVEYLEP